MANYLICTKRKNFDFGEVNSHNFYGGGGKNSTFSKNVLPCSQMERLVGWDKYFSFLLGHFKRKLK